MSVDNSILYKYISDLISIPLARKYIEEAGGYIISSGLIWPIDNLKGETFYYHIDILKKETFFLLGGDLDLDNSEVVLDQDELLFVISNLQTYLEVTNLLALEKAIQKQFVEIRFLNGKSPKIGTFPDRGLYFVNFSLS